MKKMPFRNSRTLKIELSEYGSYLGRNEGCFEVRNKNGKKQQYPHFEKQIGECVLKSGNYVSVDALIDLALWNIDTYRIYEVSEVDDFRGFSRSAEGFQSINYYSERGE